jgi:hypothetical protein
MFYVSTPVVSFSSIVLTENQTDYNYGRALIWTAVMTFLSQLHPQFNNVFSIEAVNEPIANATQTPGLGDCKRASHLRLVRTTYSQLGLGSREEFCQDSARCRVAYWGGCARVCGSRWRAEHGESMRQTHAGVRIEHFRAVHSSGGRCSDGVFTNVALHRTGTGMDDRLHSVSETPADRDQVHLYTHSVAVRS